MAPCIATCLATSCARRRLALGVDAVLCKGVLPEVSTLGTVVYEPRDEGAGDGPDREVSLREVQLAASSIWHISHRTFLALAASRTAGSK